MDSQFYIGVLSLAEIYLGLVLGGSHDIYLNYIISNYFISSNNFSERQSELYILWGSVQDYSCP